MKVEVPFSVLRILAPFASADETRYNLNGVHVAEGVAVTCDGHRMMVCESERITVRDVPEGKGPRDVLIRPANVLAVKLKAKLRADVLVRLEGEKPAEVVAELVPLHPDVEADALGIPSVRLGGLVELVDFPNYRQVMPRAFSRKHEAAAGAWTNARYLGAFADAAAGVAELVGLPTPMLRVEPGETDCHVMGVSFNEPEGSPYRFRGALMPMRG